MPIADVPPCFVEHRLTLRAFDKFCKVTFKYDPPTRGHHNKDMCGMTTDGHIHTLNHDVKRLEQKQYDQEDFSSEIYAPRVGEMCYISEDSIPRPAKIITNIDDTCKSFATHQSQRTQKRSKC